MRICVCVWNSWTDVKLLFHLGFVIRKSRGVQSTVETAPNQAIHLCWKKSLINSVHLLFNFHFIFVWHGAKPAKLRTPILIYSNLFITVVFHRHGWGRGREPWDTYFPGHWVCQVCNVRQVYIDPVWTPQSDLTMNYTPWHSMALCLLILFIHGVYANQFLIVIYFIGIPLY